VKVPKVAVVLAATVRVDVAKPPEAGVTEVGTRVSVTPVGAPEAVRLTAALKSLSDVTFMVEAPELP
jgi:hypothetical protein